MAKRRLYRRRRPMTGRRVVLILMVAAAVVAAGWRLLLYEPSPQPLETPLNGAEVVEPEVTPPGGPVEPEVTPPTAAVPVTTPRPNRPAPPAVTTEPEPTPTVAEQPRPKPQPAPKPQLSMAQRLLAEGKVAFDKQDMVVARQKISQAVLRGLSTAEDNAARELLNQAAEQWLFSRKIFENDPFCDRYRVQSGDMLVRIAKEYDVPYQLLMRVNGIANPSNLRAGETIKVVQGPFHCVVDRDRFIMTVFLGDVIARTYPVGLGAAGRDTPNGKWLVRSGAKLINPEWTDPDTGKRYLPNDPDNPLGERWMGLEGVEGAAVGRIGFGIHGTIKPQEIGRAVSRGCIRLYNGDVRELFDMLVEGKTTVTVVGG